MNDREFLEWIRNRLIDIHGENPNFDYMLRLKDVINNANNDAPHIKRYPNK